MCTMGTTPSLLTVTPTPPHDATAPVPAVLLATVTDVVPMTNIKPFGMCHSPSNPAVIAAKGPVPCIPVTGGPWTPPRTVAMSGFPVFDQTATCQCAWAGTITVANPGQTLAVTTP